MDLILQSLKSKQSLQQSGQMQSKQQQEQPTKTHNIIQELSTQLDAALARITTLEG